MRDELTSGRDATTWSPLDSDGRYAARNATTALRDALVCAGSEKDFPYLRADLNAFGHGFVELGRVAPDTAERLAELLRQGEPFDTVTGLPDSLRGGKVVLSLLELALKYIDARWAEASAKQGGQHDRRPRHGPACAGQAGPRTPRPGRSPAGAALVLCSRWSAGGTSPHSCSCGTRCCSRRHPPARARRPRTQRTRW
ncbi:hypothetical protein GCM10010499_32780 [Streptomyces thermoviolaceus subsp. apingens]|nr:hypothetical protein GCM10010499_32780 [Streptomyces thermoviolaceus subsp. apingens]